VPKTPKPKANAATAAPQDAAEPTPATSSTTVAGPAAKKRAAASRKSGAKKKSGDTAPKKRAGKPRAKAAPPAEPSDAEIRLRAYFIAERRLQHALQGDPAKDWLEAKQQLMDEARQRG
jgi:hypothetical protein